MSSKGGTLPVRVNELSDLIRGREVIDGQWRLGPRHKIQYRRRGREQEVVLSGELIAAEPNGLVIRVSERSDEDRILSRTLTLRGRWEADAHNRLNFLVERRNERQDRLTFAGGWQVNDRHELAYRFERLALKTRQRDTHTLTFRGHWDLSDDRRLTYVLGRDSNSLFRFRGTFQTASLLEKRGEIRYQVGVEVEGRRKVQTVTLFGKWKLSQNLTLEFEVPYGKGISRTITFGAAYAPTSRDTLSARLTSAKGEPLGMELLLTRQFLKGQGEAFLRLRRSVEETAAEGGFRFRW